VKPLTLNFIALYTLRIANGFAGEGSEKNIPAKQLAMRNVQWAMIY
jgi:hypothetical protein